MSLNALALVYMYVGGFAFGMFFKDPGLSLGSCFGAAAVTATILYFIFDNIDRL